MTVALLATFETIDWHSKSIWSETKAREHVSAHACLDLVNIAMPSSFMRTTIFIERENRKSSLVVGFQDESQCAQASTSRGRYTGTVGDDQCRLLE